MAYTTINKSTAHFNTKLYTGNASTQAITGVGFHPDLVWIKNRSTNNSHVWTDAVRGADKTIYSNSTDAQGTGATNIGSFDSDGFTLGSNGGTNGSGNNVASWNWKANGQGSSNTDGSINTTYTSANTTAGFSIISYTGAGGTSNTLGHGLGVKPKMFIVKCLSHAGEYWGTWIDTDGDGTSNHRLSLNTDDAAYGNDPITFSNSTITLPSSANTQWDGSGRTYIGYCFAEKTGFSKFGSYTANANSNGTFTYTGFKPKFVIIKRSSGTGNWVIQDDKRSSIGGPNPNDKWLYANASDAEYNASAYPLDLLSNGFKIRHGNGSYQNEPNGATYIYLAFGQSLVGSNNIPCTAR